MGIFQNDLTRNSNLFLEFPLSHYFYRYVGNRKRLKSYIARVLDINKKSPLPIPLNTIFLLCLNLNQFCIIEFNFDTSITLRYLCNTGTLRHLINI
jgi:hypothetical protein